MGASNKLKIVKPKTNINTGTTPDANVTTPAVTPASNPIPDMEEIDTDTVAVIEEDTQTAVDAPADIVEEN
jgi:hypothetical protein